MLFEGVRPLSISLNGWTRRSRKSKFQDLKMNFCLIFNCSPDQTFFPMRIILLITSCIVITSCHIIKSPSTVRSFDSQARQLAHKYIIVDGHVDLPYRLKVINFRLTKEFLGIPVLSEEGDFDYYRAKFGCPVYVYLYPFIL